MLRQDEPVGFSDRAGPVRAPSIHDDDFKGAGLGKQVRKRPREGSLLIVGRDDDANHELMANGL